MVIALQLEPIELGPNDTLRVSVEFDYTSVEGLGAVLEASLGRGIMRSGMIGQKHLELPIATSSSHISETVEIGIPESGEQNDTYWLQAEIKGFGNTQVRTDDKPVTIVDMPAEGIGGMWDMIMDIAPMFMMMVMMGMISGMTESMTPSATKEPIEYEYEYEQQKQLKGGTQ